MSSAQVREAIEKTSKMLGEQPEKARVKNAQATATWMEGLKCRVTGPAGEQVQTDMPAGMGGAASAPNPGWLMRAALASCNATAIAMRAARRGISLATLEVTVTSESDSRGLLGLDEKVSAGLQGMRIHVKVSAPGAGAREVEELVRWACAHSPVGCANLGAAQVEVQVE
jgi:uncharacterized OsmC-like protein